MGILGCHGNLNSLDIHVTKYMFLNIASINVDSLDSQNNLDNLDNMTSLDMLDRMGSLCNFGQSGQ